LMSFICRDAVSITGVELEKVRDFLRICLTTGHAVIAFDGLDEILDTSKRREYVTLVERFSEQFPLAPTLGFVDKGYPEFD